MNLCARKILLLFNCLYDPPQTMNDLLEQNNIGAYLSKTGDEHLSEYIGPADQRVKFLTGFTGSNGLAVTCNDNVMYTDSRYFIQAENELKGYSLLKHNETPLEEFLDKTLVIRRVDLCSKLFSSKLHKSFEEKLKKRGIELVAFENDLVDIVWKDKPTREFNEVYPIENENLVQFYSKNLKGTTNIKGLVKDNDFLTNADYKLVSLTYKEKLRKVKEFIEKDEMLLISELGTIAWILNLRGSDIQYNPVFYSYMTITKDTVRLFANGITNLDGVVIDKYESFEDYIKSIKEKVVFSGDVNAYIANHFPNAQTNDEVRRLQSIKGANELEGFHLAYILDGIALTQLFDFIEKNFKDLKEKDVAEKLEDLKKSFHGFRGPSFATIAGAGENSAIVHYEAGDKQLENDMPILIDSGSNYLFGTTDITRTLFIGKPSAEFRKYYTLVLKGQLRAMFGTYPVGVSGNVVDALTRLDLWTEQKDYGHASGHGVGHFLCVHEHPPSLSPNLVSKIEPNQIFSIEPGYYDKYGIRIENLVVSQEIEKKFMKFANITYVPYQLDIIDVDLLTNEEIGHINALSVQIRITLERFLKGDECYEYLIRNTTPIKR